MSDKQFTSADAGRQAEYFPPDSETHKMLRAYAARLEQDERAVPVAMFKQSGNLLIEHPLGATPLFTHPAPAAQGVADVGDLIRVLHDFAEQKGDADLLSHVQRLYVQLGYPGALPPASLLETEGEIPLNLADPDDGYNQVRRYVSEISAPDLRPFFVLQRKEIDRLRNQLAAAPQPPAQPQEQAEADRRDAKRWLVFNIGCLECGVSSNVVGRYSSEEDAEKVAEALNSSLSWREEGQNSFQVFDLFAEQAAEYSAALAAQKGV